MTLIQAITKAQRLTQQTGAQHVVVEEQFREHKPSYHVLQGLQWARLATSETGAPAKYRRVYPPEGQR